MSSIEAAIDQLEQASSTLKKLDREEERATREAARAAEKEARAKVKEDFKERRAILREDVREAQRQIKDAQNRINRALNTKAPGSPVDRAPAGYREQQIIEIVTANPGVKLADIAREIGINPATVSPVTKRMAEQGKLVKSAEKTYTIK